MLWWATDLFWKTLPDDLREIEIVRYEPPVVTIIALDENDRPIADFQASGDYQWRRPRSGDVDVKVALDAPAGATLLIPAGSDVAFLLQNDGRIRTTGLLPNEATTFVVSAPGYESASQTISLREGERRELKFKLKENAK